MLYTHTIGRIGKDCQVITGTHGTFMAVDIAVDDYSKGQNITTWVRVRSSRENHVRLAEYLTKGRLILVEGTISTSQWTDRQGESHTQISINADSIAFVNAGKKEEQNDNPKRAAKKGAKAKPPSATAGCSRTRREGLAILTRKGGRNEICKAFRSLSWIFGHQRGFR